MGRGGFEPPTHGFQSVRKIHLNRCKHKHLRKPPQATLPRPPSLRCSKTPIWSGLWRSGRAFPSTSRNTYLPCAERPRRGSQFHMRGKRRISNDNTGNGERGGRTGGGRTPLPPYVSRESTGHHRRDSAYAGTNADPNFGRLPTCPSSVRDLHRKAASSSYAAYAASLRRRAAAEPTNRCCLTVARASQAASSGRGAAHFMRHGWRRPTTDQGTPAAAHDDSRHALKAGIEDIEQQHTQGTPNPPNSRQTMTARRNRFARWPRMHDLPAVDTTHPPKPALFVQSPPTAGSLRLSHDRGQPRA